VRVLGLCAAVVLVDQATKWWAWRHASTAVINPGAGSVAGATVGGWYAGRFTGAVLDVLSFGLLSLSITGLVRRLLPGTVAVPGALMVGGWSSNLLDRLGVHRWTAPGSIRGAVDFITLGAEVANVADAFIAAGTATFLLAVVYRWMKTPHTSAARRSEAPKPRHPLRARTWIPMLAGALCIIVVVGVGAADYGGVMASTASVIASA
jgi:lipoprotein signal peptidase